MSDPKPLARLRRWRQLPSPERGLVLRLALLLPMVDLSLRMSGFQRSKARMARLIGPQPPIVADAAAMVQAQRLADLARSVGANSPWRTTCLRQALVVWWLLRRKGLPAELKIGVLRKSTPLQAHAWVELGGQALDPDAAAHLAFPDADRF